MKKLMEVIGFFIIGFTVVGYITLFFTGSQKPNEHGTARQFVATHVKLMHHSSLEISGYEIREVEASFEGKEYFRVSNGNNSVQGSLQLNELGEEVYRAGPVVWSIEKAWEIEEGEVTAVLKSPNGLHFQYSVKVDHQWWNRYLFTRIGWWGLGGGLFVIIVGLALNSRKSGSRPPKS